MMISGQSGRWLCGLCLDVAVHLVVDAIGCSVLLGLGSRWSFAFSRRRSELLGHLQIGVDGVHAEVEIRAVLLIVLGANMRTRFFGWRKDVGRSTALNGQNRNIK